MKPDSSLIETILLRVKTLTSAKEAAPEHEPLPVAATLPQSVTSFPTEWFKGLVKPAAAPKATTTAPQIGMIATRSVVNRDLQPSLRPVLSIARSDLGTATVVIVPIYSASRQVTQLGTNHVLNREATTFIGLMMLIGTDYIFWTTPAQSPLATTELTALGVTVTEGDTCPEAVRNALEAGAVAVCADYELTRGFYRRTGWPDPSRWYDLLAASSLLNFPSDLIGIAAVILKVAIPQSRAGLRP